MPVAVTQTQAPPTIVDWHWRFTLDHPERAVISWLTLIWHRRGCRQECLRLSDWGVLMLDVIMNIAVIIYSRHLNLWRRSGLNYYFFEGIAPPIYLNAFMFAQIIRDPALSPEEVSIRFFSSFQVSSFKFQVSSFICHIHDYTEIV